MQNFSSIFWGNQNIVHCGASVNVSSGPDYMFRIKSGTCNVLNLWDKYKNFEKLSNWGSRISVLCASLTISVCLLFTPLSSISCRLLSFVTCGLNVTTENMGQSLLVLCYSQLESATDSSGGSSISPTSSVGSSTCSTGRKGRFKLPSIQKFRSKKVDYLRCG